MTTLAPLHQEIRVNFRYGVYFTEDVFAPHNPLLAEIVAGEGVELPRKILVVVDRGLYRHHPHLLEKIAAPSPKFVSLAILTASCLSLALMMAATGPNSSSSYAGMPGRTSVSMVGG